MGREKPGLLAAAAGLALILGVARVGEGQPPPPAGASPGPPASRVEETWRGSAHQRAGLSCTTCHEPRAGDAAEPGLLRKPEILLCSGCHLQRKDQIVCAGHAPIREERLRCSSCHDPHGTGNRKLLRQVSVNGNCYTCHPEKRGPFLFEHAPVSDGCVDCHEVHGTPNPGMLKLPVPALCQQCHRLSNHPGPSDPTPSHHAPDRGCLHCHVKIHGSNDPSGHRFLR